MPLTSDGYTFELSNAVQRSRLTYRNLHGITIAADLYRAQNIDTNERHPALVIGPPHGGVKEQGPGSYANELAQRGFVVLAFDPSYYGESGGDTRHFTSPEIYAEDFSAGVDALGRLPFVDRERIGAIGICGSGGFALNAASSDPRIKAVAVLSMYDISGVSRDGWFFEGGTQARRQQLRDLAAARWADVDAGGMALGPSFPLGAYDPTALDPITAEFFEYYAKVNDRGWHPRSIGAHTVTSSIAHVAHGQMANLEDLEGRGVLLVAGEQAHSRWFSERAFANIPDGDKELLLVPGARHIDLYDDLSLIPMDTLDAFFRTRLG